MKRPGPLLSRRQRRLGESRSRPRAVSSCGSHESELSCAIAPSRDEHWCRAARPPAETRARVPTGIRTGRESSCDERSGQRGGLSPLHGVDCFFAGLQLKLTWHLTGSGGGIGGESLDSGCNLWPLAWKGRASGARNPRLDSQPRAVCVPRNVGIRFRRNSMMSCEAVGQEYASGS